MIEVRPTGGLANRMRAIDSAVALSECLQQQLILIWDISWNLNCSYFELFQPTNQFEVQELRTYGRRRYLSPAFWRHIYAVESSKKRLRIISESAKRRRFDHIIELPEQREMEKGDCNIIDTYRRFKRLYVESFIRFQYPRNPYACFVPVTELQSEIDKLHATFPSNTVGIHIRRTDNVKSILFSPLEMFVDAMRNEVDKIPETKFFLCTDCPHTEGLIREIFPKRIITREKVLARNRSDGIKDALIDMYCLAQTKRIYGSYWSSFSETAGELTDIPVTILKREWIKI